MRLFSTPLGQLLDRVREEAPAEADSSVGLAHTGNYVRTQGRLAHCCRERCSTGPFSLDVNQESRLWAWFSSSAIVSMMKYS